MGKRAAYFPGSRSLPKTGLISCKTADFARLAPAQNLPRRRRWSPPWLLFLFPGVVKSSDRQTSIRTHLRHGNLRIGRVADRSAPEGGEQDLAELRVLEERERGAAVPVEVGGLFEEGHEAVDARELDQGVDRAIVEAG